MPFARGLNLYLFMLREWANKEGLEAIDNWLKTPPSWRDPTTGRPEGFQEEDEFDRWARERQAARSRTR